MWKPRKAPPVFSVLRADTVPRVSQATQNERDLIEAVMGPGWDVERFAFDNTDTHIFRLSKLGEAAVVFRLETDPDDARVLSQFRLAEWLHQHGVSTPRPLAEPSNLPDPHIGRYSLYEFVAHRPPSLEQTDMQCLGEGVAALHGVLPQHPDRAEWERWTEARIDELKAVRRRVATGELQAGPFAGRLAVLAGRDDLDFEMPEADRLPLHGDLNRGNLYMRLEHIPEERTRSSDRNMRQIKELGRYSVSGETEYALDEPKISILDFEDVMHSVLPRVFEMAFLIERHVFVIEPDDRIATASASCLRDSYRHCIAGSKKEQSEADLSGRSLYDATLSINLRSLMVLAMLEDLGSPQPRAEWEKFFHLFDSAEARRSAYLAMG